MPRTARIPSPTDVYHVMLRGINRQVIFFDDEDYRKFESLLRRYKEICGCKLFAYCLMNNHVHLLIKPENEPLHTIFRRIGTSFVYWYNTKYDRAGHLFQDRYKSEPVCDERYFWTVLRYILNNPSAAGLCSSPAAYPYSSAREYLQSREGITDTGFVLEMRSRDALAKYLLQENEDRCLDLDEDRHGRYTDAAAKNLILREFGSLSPSVGKGRLQCAADQGLHHLVREGVSVRQISRITGLSRKLIDRRLKALRTSSVL